MSGENVRIRSGEAIRTTQVPERATRPRIDATDRVPGRLSVILPTYDRNGELQEAVESLGRQTYPDIEVVIVDDGSSTPVSETLGDARFRLEGPIEVFRHPENLGANVARNTGIYHSTGEFVSFLDDDDRWRADKAERTVETFESTSPSVGVVYTGTRVKAPMTEETTTPTHRGNVAKALLTGENFGQFSSVAVRVDAIEEVGLPDERLPAWQDREWFFRLSKHCHFEPIPEPLTIRHVDREDRIGYDFEKQRDVAYPIFVRKHYDFARERGRYYARTFLASLRYALGRTAVRAGRYDEARKYFLSSLIATPTYRPTYPHLVASLCGKRSYETARSLRRSVLKVLEHLR